MSFQRLFLNNYFATNTRHIRFRTYQILTSNNYKNRLFFGHNLGEKSSFCHTFGIKVIDTLRLGFVESGGPRLFGFIIKRIPCFYINLHGSKH